MYKIDISKGSKRKNHSKQPITTELTIQTFQISGNTLDLIYKIDIPRGSKTQNHLKQAISSDLTIQTYQIRENTLYLHDQKYLSASQSSFVILFYVKITKNVTVCTKLTFQRVQKREIIQNNQ